MFNNLLKSISILKKFLFINLVIFLIIGSFTILYIKNVKPNLSSLKTTTKQNLQCKFLNNCNDEYKSTGANLNLDSESGMLTCGDGSTLKKATAIASTNEEYYIDKIYLTNQGLGYTTNPIVKII